MSWRRLRLPLSLAAVLLAGCAGEFVFETPGGGGTGPLPDGGTANSEARQFFGNNIEPMLTVLRPSGPCVLCHSEGTPYAAQGAPELFGNRQTSDITYTSIKSSGFLGTSPETSPFRNVMHTDPTIGDSFCSAPGVPYEQCTQDELSLIDQWIGLEN